MTDMQGKCGIVTGAGSGIGRASAVRLARAGAAVLVTDIDAAAAEATATTIRATAGGVAFAMRTDIADDASVDEMVAACLARFGRLDFAHNNAGVVGTQQRIVDYSSADYDRILAINLKGTFLCMRAELQVMVPQRSGSIVNTASAASIKGSAADAVYTASKHGVAGLTKVAALENARRGIRVNSVCPGVILTGILEEVERTNPEQFQKTKSLMPINRYGLPEEIAEAVLWLCSDASSLMTGQMMSVDGGWSTL